MDMFNEWKSGDCPKKKVMKWSPPGRRKRGRPKLTWEEEIRRLMEKKGLMEEDGNDRDKWKTKIQGGSNMTGTDLCVNIYKSVPVIFEPPCNIIVKWAQEDVETSYYLLNK